VALKAKQDIFCQEYLRDLNATQAAIRAGYSQDTAGSIGHDLLKKPEIIAEIDRLKLERSRETKIDAAWLLKRFADEADADVADLYDEDGRLKPVKDWPMIWRQGLVAGVKTSVSEDGVAIIDVKLSDRVRRLELIGKHVSVQAFQENVNHTGVDALADRLSRAKKRLKDG
jgi:phage terminase small subunit